MMLLALSFVFGSMRSVTMGARIMLGVITGFLFYLSNETLGPLAVVYNLPPLLGALGPSFIFAAIAMLQLRRA